VLCGEAICKHCGKEFEQGPCYRRICNWCLNHGHKTIQCEEPECLFTEDIDVVHYESAELDTDPVWPETVDPKNTKNTNTPKGWLFITGKTIEQIQLEVIQARVDSFAGNMRKAARSLKISHATIYRRYKISPKRTFMRKYWGPERT